MQLDLSSADSLFAWWRVWPERHDSYLDYKLSVSPEFAPAIHAARRQIAASSGLLALRERSVEHGTARQHVPRGRTARCRPMS
ncbi:hypothetical protein [Pelomonas cellulosilytica]|uniref:Uncharacterized protein n=1 Tax=Pelomonas cellulosilytica TaxID=2906762 RepID=A0ABS8XSH5_9BURK|nr:hypothetical protein [Pelomonas sp. P8]MCE4554245.1 hypothetical protein [Pelomonas sp. P8]